MLQLQNWPFKYSCSFLLGVGALLNKTSVKNYNTFVWLKFWYLLPKDNISFVFWLSPLESQVGHKLTVISLSHKMNTCTRELLLSQARTCISNIIFHVNMHCYIIMNWGEGWVVVLLILVELLPITI